MVSEDASTVEMLQEHIDQLGETIRMWDTYDRYADILSPPPIDSTCAHRPHVPTCC